MINLFSIFKSCVKSILDTCNYQEIYIRVNPRMRVYTSEPYCCERKSSPTLTSFLGTGILDNLATSAAVWCKGNILLNNVSATAIPLWCRWRDVSGCDVNSVTEWLRVTRAAHATMKSCVDLGFQRNWVSSELLLTSLECDCMGRGVLKFTLKVETDWEGPSHFWLRCIWW